MACPPLVFPNVAPARSFAERAPRQTRLCTSETILILAGLTFLPMVYFAPQLYAQRGLVVDFEKLSGLQQTLYQTYNLPWEGLNGSEQLEYASATQALGDWWNDKCDPRQPGPSLQTVVSVVKIHGQVAHAPSAQQFNLEVGWIVGADRDFKQADGWSSHIALLHNKQFGYQQNKCGNPFLGLVVLFDKQNKTVGQFHIGFRSFFNHYRPINGNPAANYDKFVKWYGPILGYYPDAAKLDF